jgi:hypothetical protein
MDPLDKQKADNIIERLIELNLQYDDEDNLKRGEIQEEFEQIPNINKYRHKYPKDVPYSYVISYTIMLLKHYGSDFNYDREHEYIMKLTPELVKTALNNFYNEGSLFNVDVMDIYRHGWKNSAMTDSDPRETIWENIKESIDGEKYTLDFIFKYSAAELDAFIAQFTNQKYENLYDKRYMAMYYLHENDMLDYETKILLSDNGDKFRKALEISNTAQELRDNLL